MSQNTFTVSDDQDGLRLDVFLTRVMPDHFSRTMIKSIIKSGRIFLNGKQVSAHYKVASGEQIVVDYSDDNHARQGIIPPEEIPLDIFYEDQNLLVIYKPEGMLVHPVHGQRTGTLVNALLHYCHVSGATLSDVNASAEVKGVKQKELIRPGIVHRLDRETSGLMLVAKDNWTHVRLARQFEKHQVKKRYVAVVKGVVDFDEGVIDAPLGRHHRHWDKKSISFDDSSKEAKTFYRVLKRFDQKATLVALFPQSGRTHQLRVHMGHLGHPILGDTKYGGGSHFPRMALHAQMIGFRHPQTKKFIEFSSLIPAEFLEPLQNLD
ncbi:MAG: RluA family pseudouridine synthase [Candidatus Omnitrophica bacterium]|nr:RluA family pseudouridine synthase [Candidatus Omnitrophota bacterium]